MDVEINQESDIEEEMKEEVKDISIILVKHDSKLSRGFGQRI